MDECIFCAIARGEVPSHKIFEDENTLAFLGIYPPVEGFTLVIPKNHSSDVWQMEQDDYLNLMKTVKKVGNRLKDIYFPMMAGIKVEGLEVAHTHFKVFPFKSNAEFIAKEPTGKPNHKKLAAVAEKIKF